MSASAYACGMPSPTIPFNDHFSGHALAYAASRPDYPPALFDWLARQAPWHDLALDVGCGNGQCAYALTRHFEAVHATDASAAQIAAARPHPRLRYRVEPAEHIAEKDRSVALLTVAQAIHWFDFPLFFNEVGRVLQSDGVFAAIGYGLLHSSPEIDALIHTFEHRTVGKYWPPERRHIDDGYQSIAFPFDRMTTPEFALEKQWALAELLAYLRTWSATQRCQQATGNDPLAGLEPTLQEVWGDPAQTRSLRWPLLLWVGR